MAPLLTSHWLRPVSRVALVTKGHDALPALGGLLLGHRRHRGQVTLLEIARNCPHPHPLLGHSRWTPRREICSWGEPWGFRPSRTGHLAGHSSGPWHAPSSEQPSCSRPAWLLAPPRHRRRVSLMLTALLAHALSLLPVVSQLRQRCRGAVAPTIAAVAVTVPSRCSSAVVVTLPSRSCGRPPRVHASRSTALPCRPCRSPLASCLVGGVVRVVVAAWGVVAARTRLAPYLSASRPPLALRPSRHRRRHHRWRRWRSPHCGGGNVIVLGIIHHQCKRRLVNSRASSCLRCARTYERFVVLATSTRFFGRGRCLVVGGGGARRVWAPRGANVGLDRALGRHRSSSAAAAAALASRLAVMRCWGGRTR
jgi:hypothetical protein